jgi:hypothetical protein
MIKVLKVLSEANTLDTLTLDIPLFIRLLEYAREDAPGDAALHKLTENAIRINQSGVEILGMDNYENMLEGIPQKEQAGLGAMLKKLAANILLAMDMGLYKFQLVGDRLSWTPRSGSGKRSIPFAKDMDVSRASSVILHDILNETGYSDKIDNDQKHWMQVLQNMSNQDIAKKWKELAPIVDRGAELIGTAASVKKPKITLVRKK